MEFLKPENFKRGWVVGNFEPALIKTKDFEFAVQYFKTGGNNEKHIRKVSREITIIIFGEFKLNDKVLTGGT